MTHTYTYERGTPLPKVEWRGLPEQPYGFMWGNFEPETEPVVKVRLTGFDDRKTTIVGRLDVAWREFMYGFGGTVPSGQERAGFAEIQTDTVYLSLAEETVRSFPRCA